MPSERPRPHGPRLTHSSRWLRARVWLSSSMWAPVLVANVIAIALGLALPALDKSLVDRESLPITLSSAEQIFGALAGGMITFTGIVFSAVFVAAQIQTTSYSPRIAARLRHDRVVIAALALPTATASYALFALAAIGRQTSEVDKDVAPAITVIVALVLAVITFGAFVALVQRAFDSTQIGGILRGLLRQAHRVVHDVHPDAVGSPEAPTARLDEPVSAEIRHVGQPGVFASVDRGALLRVAHETGAFVEVVPPIGQYVPPGSVLLRLRGGTAVAEDRLLRRVTVLSRQRTLAQDPAFALRMLVDIAIRGLSPAVNDPTTAVQSLDRIEALLVELHDRRLGATVITDDSGGACGIVPGPTWDEYFGLAVMEIRHYGASSAQIERRLRALYDHLLQIVDPPQRARVELEQRLLDDALVENFPDPDEQAILRRPDRLGLGSVP